MTFQAARSERSGMTAAFFISLAAHALLLAAMLAGAWLARTPRVLKPSVYTVTLVDAPLTLEAPAAKPSPPAAGPDKKPKAPATAKPPPAAKPAAPAAKPAESAPRQAKETSTSPAAAAKPAAPAAPSAKEAKPPQAKAAPPRAEPVPAQAVAQRLAALRARYGHLVAPEPEAGDAGEAGERLQTIRLQVYQQLVREKITAAWILPLPSAEARQLEATALLRVGRDGEVVHFELLQGSGNELFDASLRRAVQQAAPLPPLPEDYRGAYLEVLIRFRPRET
ncbi:MAG: hypothetical protein KatS3mg131_2581 [Candidatus Tectimicrobiota bacterium]|nr:MAG: hypothetical protein KatS3mg131_2581 [Candidatus Tectomicrobia bacterium]